MRPTNVFYNGEYLAEQYYDAVLSLEHEEMHNQGKGDGGFDHFDIEKSIRNHKYFSLTSEAFQKTNLNFLNQYLDDQLSWYSRTFFNEGKYLDNASKEYVENVLKVYEDNVRFYNSLEGAEKRNESAARDVYEHSKKIYSGNKK